MPTHVPQYAFDAHIGVTGEGKQIDVPLRDTVEAMCGGLGSGIKASEGASQGDSQHELWASERLKQGWR